MATPAATAGAPAHHKPWYRHLYLQVLCAIALGVLLGVTYPSLAEEMKPLGDAFIKLIRC
jgi:aerobic C4-dicarboxylate transport protein